MIIVTSYENLDLDGYACTYAYAELLNKEGTPAEGTFYGTPHPEAQFVLEEFEVTPLRKGTLEDGRRDVILVDTSELSTSPKEIAPEAVIEIIDHRFADEADEFPNAKVQIEQVGAAATLIAERFMKAKIEPSEEAAALLYCAIISNTINFQNKITTQRDKDAFTWLGKRFSVPTQLVERMFMHKSALTRPLTEIFLSEHRPKPVRGRRVGIIQLEIVDAQGFLDSRHEEIGRALLDVRRLNALDLAFLTIIDVLQGYNIIYAKGEREKEMVRKILGINFDDDVARTDHVVMRKEIFPRLVSYLERENS